MTCRAVDKGVSADRFPRAAKDHQILGDQFGKISVQGFSRDAKIIGDTVSGRSLTVIRVEAQNDGKRDGGFIAQLRVIAPAALATNYSFDSALSDERSREFTRWNSGSRECGRN